MTTIPDPIIPPPNRFSADAEERMARLRLMAAEFPDETDPDTAISSGEMSLARSTTAASLEKAAVFMQTAPAFSGMVADPNGLREAIAFEQAYGGVRDEARSLARRIDLAILRRKLKAARGARAMYRMAKGYASVPEGESVRTHVADLKRTFSKPRARRKKAAAPPAVQPHVTEEVT